jgi:hypothetical protein
LKLVDQLDLENVGEGIEVEKFIKLFNSLKVIFAQKIPVQRLDFTSKKVEVLQKLRWVC